MSVNAKRLYYCNSCRGLRTSSKMILINDALTNRSLRFASATPFSKLRTHGQVQAISYKEMYGKTRDSPRGQEYGTS